jgi:hypothetical protein
VAGAAAVWRGAVGRRCLGAHGCQPSSQKGPSGYPLSAQLGLVRADGLKEWAREGCCFLWKATTRSTDERPAPRPLHARRRAHHPFARPENTMNGSVISRSSLLRSARTSTSAGSA